MGSEPGRDLLGDHPELVELALVHEAHNEVPIPILMGFEFLLFAALAEKRFHLDVDVGIGSGVAVVVSTASQDRTE